MFDIHVFKDWEMLNRISLFVLSNPLTEKWLFLGGILMMSFLMMLYMIYCGTIV